MRIIDPGTGRYSPLKDECNHIPTSDLVDQGLAKHIVFPMWSFHRGLCSRIISFSKNMRHAKAFCETAHNSINACFASI